MIVWQSDDTVHPFRLISDPPDNNGFGIYGQRFDALDNKIGDEFKINTYVNSTQSSPSIASLDDGSFYGGLAINRPRHFKWPCGYFGIYAQLFSAGGSKLGSELRVNTTTNMEQTNPSITHLSDNSLVVVWEVKCT